MYYKQKKIKKLSGLFSIIACFRKKFLKFVYKLSIFIIILLKKSKIWKLFASNVFFFSKRNKRLDYVDTIFYNGNVCKTHATLIKNK